jgi:hypothetical protein
MNEDARKVLDNYLDTERLAVPHAILITGKWGSGKTHFLQNIYEPERQRRLNEERRYHVPFLFVSLFGAASAHDVELRIYKAACPGEAVAGAVAGTIALGLGEFFRVKEAAKGVVDKLGKKAIKRLNDYVFVLDDLERVEAKAFDEVLELINSLVADHGRRVIIVADEDRLKSIHTKSHWNDQNEKMVGRRAEIKPDFGAVIHDSANRIPKGPLRQFLINNSESLLEVARASGVENLRNIAWAVHNAEMFSGALLSDAAIPEAHVLKTMQVVFATTLWLRSGKLTSSSLQRIPGLQMQLAARSLSRKEDVPLERDVAEAKEFVDAFPELGLEAPPLKYEFLDNFERSGVLNANEVVLWVKSQFGFGSEHKEPSWRRLWHSFERPRAETKKAVEELRKELADRAYSDIGSILHCAGLAIRRWALEEKIITNGEDIVEYFKAYIDELSESDKLERVKTNSFQTDFEGDGGLGFISSDTPEFKEICEYILQKSKDAADADMSAVVSDILTEAENGNLDALFRFIRNDEYELSQNPVLSDVPVDRVASFMARDFPQLNAGRKLLAYRYSHVRTGHQLFKEIPWARAVYIAVLERLNDWNEPDRAAAVNSLQSIITHYEKDKLPDEKIISG